MAVISRFVLAVICMISILAEAIPAAGKTVDASADVVSVDSVGTYSFDGHRLVTPVALIAAGSFGASNGWFRKHVDRSVDHAMGSSRQLRSADYIEFLPLAASIGLGSVGVRSDFDLKDRTLMAVTSFVVLEAVTQPVKRIVGRTRPDMSDDHSFPSGHTATAFAGAELCRIEYGMAYGAGAYAVAAGVAAMRMAGRHHWLSDCVAGAGVGILSARIAAWLLPMERKLLFGRRATHSSHNQPLTAAFCVVPQVSSCSAGFAAVAVF